MTTIHISNDAVGARPPDWRWKEVEYRYKHRMSSNGETDEWLRRAHTFYRKQYKTDPEKLRGTIGDLEDILTAHEINQGYGRSEYEDKFILEAFLLAGESCDEIAAYKGWNPEPVEAYEAIFYDVREGLHLQGYVKKQIPRSNELWGNNDEHVLKFIAGQWGAEELRCYLMDKDLSLDDQLKRSRNRTKYFLIRKLEHFAEHASPARDSSAEMLINCVNNMENRELLESAKGLPSSVLGDGLNELKLSNFFELDISPAEREERLPANEVRSTELIKTVAVTVKDAKNE